MSGNPSTLQAEPLNYVCRTACSGLWDPRTTWLIPSLSKCPVSIWTPDKLCGQDLEFSNLGKVPCEWTQPPQTSYMLSRCHLTPNAGNPVLCRRTSKIRVHSPGEHWLFLCYLKVQTYFSLGKLSMTLSFLPSSSILSN